MKTLADLLLLGDLRLYEVCAPVEEADLPQVVGWVADLHQVMAEVRARYGFGRGIAAPQLGIMKRLVYLNIDRPVVLLNPELPEPAGARAAAPVAYCALPRRALAAAGVNRAGWPL